MFPIVFRSLAWATTGLVVAAGSVAVHVRPDRTASSTMQVSAAALPTAGDTENPLVAPGLVGWHKSFSDAQAAAKRSGKPVLLFHMIGQLDRQFC